jgi:hypothetical protein
VTTQPRLWPFDHLHIHQKVFNGHWSSKRMRHSLLGRTEFKRRITSGSMRALESCVLLHDMCSMNALRGCVQLLQQHHGFLRQTTPPHLARAPCVTRAGSWACAKDTAACLRPSTHSNGASGSTAWAVAGPGRAAAGTAVDVDQLAAVHRVCAARLWPAQATARTRCCCWLVASTAASIVTIMTQLHAPAAAGRRTGAPPRMLVQAGVAGRQPLRGCGRPRPGRLRARA